MDLFRTLQVECDLIKLRKLLINHLEVNSDMDEESYDIISSIIAEI